MRKPGSNGAETLRNLRTAAIQLLAEHGYGAMNLRMLAKKVGIQASSLYNYIDSKQQLLFLLCEETTENLLAEFDQTVKTADDPKDRLRRFVECHLGFHIVNRKQASVLQMEMRSLTAKNFEAISKIPIRFAPSSMRGLRSVRFRSRIPRLQPSRCCKC
jgi:AcrR family transcriptional regulator